MKIIRIVNPRPGHARFTSERAARKYVERRKTARWADENHDSIFLYHDTCKAQDQHATLVEVKAAARRLGKVVFWNGEDPDEFAVHRPGEVRC